MGRQASCRRPSISARLAVAVPSSLGRKVTGGAQDSSFSHRYTAPWSEDQASSSQARHSRMRSLSSALSVARTFPASAGRRRRSDASEPSRWSDASEASDSKSAYYVPSARSLSGRRWRAVHERCTAHDKVPAPCAGRSSRPAGGGRPGGAPELPGCAPVGRKADLRCPAVAWGSWSVSLPRGGWEGAGVSVAPEGRESG